MSEGAVEPTRTRVPPGPGARRPDSRTPDVRTPGTRSPGTRSPVTAQPGVTTGPVAPARVQEAPVRAVAAPTAAGAAFLGGVDPGAGDVTPVAAPTPLLRISDRFVRIPGRPGLYPVYPGAPFRADELVILLQAALDARRAVRQAMALHPLAGVYTMATQEEPPLPVLEVLRLADRPTWLQARSLFEASTGESLLGRLQLELSDRELGAALPYLRGVVASADLIRVWTGTFSSDVPGIVRVLERMPDAEALALAAEYRTMQGIAGTTARALATAVEESAGGEEGGAYRALRALAGRMRRLSTATGPGLSTEDREAAGELVGELRVLAAFARIKEADRRYRTDWAYLAVADLDRRERDGLDLSYLTGWRGRHLTGDRRRGLENLLRTGLDDVDYVLAALERSGQAAAENRDQESAVGLEAAAPALDRALRRLAARAADPTLAEDQRTAAQERLTALAEDPDVLDRVLALPGGDRIARGALGASGSTVARRRVLRATSVSEVVDALRGLHGIDVGLVLGRPDVEAHLAAQEIVINPAVRRVLDAYGEVQGAQVEPFLRLPAGTSFLPVVPGLDEGLDLGPQGEDLAPVVAAPLVLRLPGAEPVDDPLVVVAAYEAYRAARGGDVAGVVAAVRPLRPGRRALLQDDTFFRSALETLDGMRTDVARSVATVLRDPSRDPAEASAALIRAGLEGEPGHAFDVRDERLLGEGLAVDPADRRLLRYRYVLDALGEEDRLAGVTDYYGRRIALGSRGVPVDYELPERLESAYSDRLYALDRLDPTPRLRMEDVFLGEPEILRADLTPEEAALEAQYMRVRLDKHLAALSRGVDASGVLGWSPETVTELTAEFQRRWDEYAADGRWTRDELVQLAAAYYDALDAVDRNRSERSSVAEFIGTLAATVAGVVVIVATGGTATPLVVGMLAGATLGAGASLVVADAFRDYTSPDQALADLGHGAVTGALTVAGQALAEPVGAVVSRQTAAFAARGAVNKAVAGGARLAVEGAIDGAIGGAGDAVFATAIDKRTWEQGVAAIFARFLAAAVQGAFVGGAVGAVASPLLGGAVAGTGTLLGRARRLVDGAGLGGVPAGAVDGLERVAALADSGRYDVALRRLDEIVDLTGADRDLLTQELYRRALASGAEGAEVSPDMLRRLDEARQVTRQLQSEAGPARAGEARPRLDVAPVEDLLARLERDLGAAEVAHVRKIIYGEIRLSPEELIVRQAEFEAGLRSALDELLTPAERAALPRVEVRVLPPEAFEGMFRTRQGRALTLVEGDGAVVYVRSDAGVRAHMLQEAAHLRQLADPELAADVRLLAERNILDWASKSAEDRLHLLDVQRRLEIDAQERILAVLERDAPYADDVLAASEELDVARRRLAELRRHEEEARAITPAQLSEMNAGIRPRPAWMDEEARLFGTEVEELRPTATLEEMRRTATRVFNSSGLKVDERSFQLGTGWTKTTYTTSGVDGTVEAVAPVPTPGGRPSTAVTVRPTGGGEPRVYLVESATADVAVGDPVLRGGRLGRETQQYRLVEIRKPGAAARTREEVLDVKGRWVERGSSRTTRGTVMEEAAELQVGAQLARSAERAAAAARPGKTSLRSWFRVDFPSQRRGFDRVFVEIRGEGADTVAVIRVLEVKDYPNSYVPLAEFTAITDNFETNWRQLRGLLQTKARALAAAGEADAARALTEAIARKDLTVEVWLGPTTKMGEEAHAGSVLAALRASVDARGPNVRLAGGRPGRVSAASSRRAIEARTAAAAPPPAPVPAPTTPPTTPPTSSGSSP